jgi:hypothetical protein
MDSSKEAKLNMYHQVIQLCEGNLAIVALVAAFSTSYNVFKTTVTAIVSGAVDLETQTVGFRIAKVSAKRDLATMGSGIAGMVAAYASVISDEELEADMQISFTKINTALDDEVVAICTGIHAKANSLVLLLADYGVTPLLLTAYMAAITDYDDKKPKPLQSRAEKKGIRAQGDLLMKDADKVLKKQMDKLVVNFKTNGNALFESQYQAVRVIIDAGSFSTVLKILVVNAVNGLPLRNAKVYRDSAPLFKKTTIKGFVTFKDIEEGGHSFTIKHKLFQDYSLTGVMIAHGQKSIVTVMMVPVGVTGTPAGDPPGFDMQQFSIPAGGFIVIPLPNPLPPSLQLYFLATGGNAVICSTNLPAMGCVTGYALNQGTPFQGLIGALSLDLTKTHLEITNPGAEDIVVRVGTKV